MGTPKLYFQDGRFSVTSAFVKARNKSMRLDYIENTALSRPLLLLGLASAGGLIGLGLVFGDLLYTGEIIVFSLLGAALLAGGWMVGALTVYTKLMGPKGWSVLWWHGTLREMRVAVETAMEETRARVDGPVNVQNGSEIL